METSKNSTLALAIVKDIPLMAIDPFSTINLL